ncbi:GntR family transcriptional regulator [Pseudomonas sp. SWRI59]|uniref:GntR family transcriptional regulator n=1 Tax=unclassified Pseudomonas TaxID=196821 RepID=UPI00026F9352|nr:MULTISPECIES: GntR family transcriptional regulator [unclassified Pseudomonas]EJN39337.1 transcriptional regulator [Pseudomonas sp. GM84]MBC3503102.1 GntR family transcriptional regulator [Pseudomonas sp. SWRI59]MBC3505752.1 GntR family transcriptional regulator [Pseudomonas sp. SWRI68]
MASEQIYETLRNRIIAGQYEPGTQLKEEPLSREFELSRTPVRASLKRLVDDGLAVVETNRGVFVAGWTKWDVEEMFSLRELLEPHAAMLAAMRATEQDVQALHRINDAMASAIKRGDENVQLDVQAANREFHHQLLETARSQRLRSMLQTLIDMPVITRSFFLYAEADFARSLQQHLDITYAIEIGDGELAKQAMTTHIRMAYRRFMAHRSGKTGPS